MKGELTDFRWKEISRKERIRAYEDTVYTALGY